MCFADNSVSQKNFDRRGTAQPLKKSASKNTEHEIDLSGKKERRSTLNKQEAEEDRDKVDDNESDTFIYQGPGEDMNSEINGVSDFQSVQSGATTMMRRQQPSNAGTS